METKTRRQLVLLVALAVVVVVAITWGYGGGDDDDEDQTSLPPGRASGAAVPGRGSRPAAGAPAVVTPIALEALRAVPPDPIASSRNPFRFQQGSVPSEEDSGGGGPLRGGPGPVVQAPAPPPGPPPIPLRFIGIVDETTRHLKLAVLSDGRNVFYGREGDIIEGRYRIVRIGLESIVMTHMDGRGQQTIRLSGS
jgi:hypothetical protein